MIYLPSNNSHAELVRVFRHIQEAMNSNIPTTTTIQSGNVQLRQGVSPGGSGSSFPVVTEHNATTGKQGGNGTNEFFHLDQFTHDNVAIAPFRALVYDNNYTIASSRDHEIIYLSLAGTRYVNLPSTPVDGQRIEVMDATGAASESNAIVIMNGSTVVLSLTFPYAVGVLVRENNTWILESTTAMNIGAGVTFNPGYTLGTNSITLGTGGYSLFPNASGNGRPRGYYVLGQTLTLPAGKSYVVADYNGGTPTTRVTTNVSEINETTIVPIYTVLNSATTGTSVLDWAKGTLGNDMPNKTHQSIVKTERFRLESSIVISESATRIINLGASRAWYGGVPSTIVAASSNTTNTYQLYHVAGVWTATLVTQYNNTQYDNGTDLVALNPNRYAINWVFRSVSSPDKIFFILGTASYATVADAAASRLPGNLPPELSDFAILVGRIIVKTNDATASQIDYATTGGAIASGGVTNHNALSGIQGGTLDQYFHLTQAQYNSVTNGPAITKEYTGFSAPESVIQNYDSTARTVTLTGTVAAYWQGSPVTALVSGWVSPAHPATAGSWFLFYDGTNYIWQQTPWEFSMLQIAYVYYGASDKFGLREPHGLMPWQVHKEFHETTGTYLNSGGDLGGYVLASTTATDRRPSVSTTVVSDEDILTTIPSLADNGPYTLHYLVGSGATNTFTTASADIINLSGSQPYYNSFSGGAWGQTLLNAGDYTTVWAVAVPAMSDTGSQAYRYIWVQGQSAGTLASQQGLTFGNVNIGSIGNVFTEFVPIAKVILRYIAGNWTLTSVEKIFTTKVSAVNNSGSGSFLSAVTTDASLTGVGTAVSPLALAFGSTLPSVDGIASAGSGTEPARITHVHPTDSSRASDLAVVHNSGNETGLAGNKTWTGIHSFSNSTASTSTTTGAVVVTGGIGVGGTLTTTKIVLPPPSASGTSEVWIYNASGGDIFSFGTTGSLYAGLAWLPASSSFMYIPNNGTLHIGGASDGSISINTHGSMSAYGNISFGYGTSGLTATPSYIHTGNNYSNGTTRDKLKIYLYNSGSEQYGFGVGSNSDIQYHSNGLHDFYISNSKVVSIGSGGSVSMGALTATSGSFGTGKISQTPVAFASLPAGSAGDRAFVNNNSSGAAFGSAANGSGSTTYPVYHDGVSWKIG